MIPGPGPFIAPIYLGLFNPSQRPCISDFFLRSAPRESKGSADAEGRMPKPPTDCNKQVEWSDGTTFLQARYPDLIMELYPPPSFATAIFRDDISRHEGDHYIITTVSRQFDVLPFVCEFTC